MTNRNVYFKLNKNSDEAVLGSSPKQGSGPYSKQRVGKRIIFSFSLADMIKEWEKAQIYAIVR